MAKEKENKTNAMRILDKNKINYEVNTYECDEFIDGVHIADMLGQPYESSFKTLVTEGKSKNYYVFAIPIALELDMKKAAKAVGEKSIEMVHVKDINAVTGYIRGGCTPIGMKKQYKTVYHSTIKDFDKVIVSGGKLGTQIILAPDDLIKVTRADVCDIVKDCTEAFLRAFLFHYQPYGYGGKYPSCHISYKRRRYGVTCFLNLRRRKIYGDSVEGSFR